ncbi:MAG TPA: fibronectin type III domain-containing protein [Thermoanaerobaculia bacterium]|nr:fibronectin type III domain-containing protein [Thermoanaerobaculia bacterium]
MSRRTQVPLCPLLFVILWLWLPLAAHAVSPAERSALIDLYSSAGGPGWTDNSGWNDPAGTECSWYGVSCVDDTVTGLSLAGNNLAGTIPPSLGQLTGLDFLNLENNQLSGSLPAEIGNLASLRTLFLRFNQFSGEIPPELVNLVNLQSLRLSFNQLSGTIPATLWTLGNLQNLDLSFNQLSGEIPASVSNLINLQLLDLSGNPITGSIPAEIGNLSQLQNLLLIQTQLSGPLPTEIGNLSQLQALRIDQSFISGTIPASLGNLTQLQDLILSRTQLTGPIPAELANLTNLIRLLLSANQLSGGIPPELGNLSNLLVLGLGSNQLAGDIPGSLLNLTNLLDSNGLQVWYNALYSHDPVLIDFISVKQGFAGWQETQTVAPAGLAVAGVTATSLQVSWEPIGFSSGEGRYVVSYSTSPGGPYNVYGSTASKFDASLAITGLAPETTYYFFVQTVSDASPQNSSTLVSEPSVIVSGTTEFDTPAGTEVVVQPSDTSTGTTPVTLTFDNVTQGGATTLTTSASGPAPPMGFQLGDPPVYYEISSTALFSGQVMVCIDYTGTSFTDEDEVRLLHFESGAWTDTTVSVNTADHTVCGTVTSFSPFVVAQRTETSVRIDIKPGEFPNSINLKSKGKVPVAVLSGPDFDARRVDPRTVLLAGAPVDVTPHGAPRASFEDVDRDGRMDLLLHVQTQALHLSLGDTQAVLTGMTYEGIAIRGVDSVRIVH